MHTPITSIHIFIDNVAAIASSQPDCATSLRTSRFRELCEKKCATSHASLHRRYITSTTPLVARCQPNTRMYDTAARMLKIAKQVLDNSYSDDVWTSQPHNEPASKTNIILAVTTHAHVLRLYARRIVCAKQRTCQC